MERAFRGWLGPYLLDTLIDEARRLGIRNFQAEVLATNRRMLALLRSRGLVTLDRSDGPATVRVAVGIAAPTPVWPPRSGAARVLFELSEPRWHDPSGASPSGLQMACCRGPERGGPACPALAGRPCPLAGDADVIVLAPGDDLPLARSLLTAHRRLHPSRPLYVAGVPGPLVAGDDTPTLPRRGDAAIEVIRAAATTPHREGSQ